MGFLARLFKKSAPVPAQSTTHEEDGGDFVDIDLPVTAISALPNGALRVQARGMVDGEDVGLAVELGAEWSAQPIEGASGAFLFFGAAAYERTGPESDRFITLLARRYGAATVPKSFTMLPRVEAKMVGLNSDPESVMNAPLHAKAFFHVDTDSDDTPDAEKRYAEVFTNINLQDKILEFHEKDQEYRLPLLRALTQP